MGGGGGNMTNPPTFHVTDLFSNSPALSLSLAGIFRHGEPAAEKAVDLGKGNRNGWLREEAVEIISSENSAPSRTRTEDEDELLDDKRRKKYHRHTADQIKQMELLFKESPHPDDRQRQQLSKQLALSARQIKFWFQNRRTQIKATQERNDNSLMKTEMEKIREENNALKEAINKLCCPNCGLSKDARISSQEEQNLRIENAQLKDEIQKLRSAIENDVSRGIDRSGIMNLVDLATEELTTMAALGEPLWVRSIETGREILNYVEYQKRFPPSWTHSTRKRVEVSRETRVVLADLAMLLQCFMDVNQWREMFPCIISKAATLDVINDGELRHHRNGAVQLMVAELQMLTPTIPAREVCFVRHCKQLSSEKWVIVDVSIDNTTEYNNINDIVKFSKRPSGCIIEDQSNGRCKVTWVEHLECQNMSVPTLMYRQIINDGTAFGARRWVATLRQQCERLVYLMATNVPAKDSNGRKIILRLAHRMTRSFCLSIGASSLHKWIKLPNMNDGDDIRVSYRKNLNDPDEPMGVILCAASSVWLHVSHLVLADFLTDASRRHEWDITMSNGNPAQSLAKFAKGQDKGNSVTIQAATSENDKRILQDSTWNGCESLVVYAPLDAKSLQSAVAEGDASGGVALLPSGFCILPDGAESRAMVITRSKVDDELGGGGGGCFLTLAFQVLASNCPTDVLTMESLESVTTLVSCTLTNIKTSLYIV